jgi:hypothetical protein
MTTDPAGSDQFLAAWIRQKRQSQARARMSLNGVRVESSYDRFLQWHVPETLKVMALEFELQHVD